MLAGIDTVDYFVHQYSWLILFVSFNTSCKHVNTHLIYAQSDEAGTDNFSASGKSPILDSSLFTFACKNNLSVCVIKYYQSHMYELILNMDDWSLIGVIY